MSRGRLPGGASPASKENRHAGGTAGVNKPSADVKGSVEARLLRGAMGKDAAAFSPGMMAFGALEAVPTAGEAFSPSNFLKERS